jgi:1-acyl-sn-glycerol-3-phosphate acyltransferase
MQDSDDAAAASELTPFERRAVAIGRFANERELPKRFQKAWQTYVSQPWVKTAVGGRIFVEGVEHMLDLDPDRGVLLVSNHRSFFDMYVAMLPLFAQRCHWLKKIYFPVRANFFYERPLGVFINFFIGCGAMYPPIFRDRARAAHNDDALERLERFLSERGVLVGMHPEGTRNKGDDPYELLPAQPGVGQLVLRARPIVVPMFIHGLDNDIVSAVRMSYRRDARRVNPITCVFGPPVDYSEFTGKTPRLALYKRVADRLHDAIRAVGEHEREVRAEIAAGQHDDSTAWLRPLPFWLRGRS